MARRTIDPAVKTAVLVAALENGANLPAIAAQHGVSLPTVYNWKNAALAAKEAAVTALSSTELPVA